MRGDVLLAGLVVFKFTWGLQDLHEYLLRALVLLLNPQVRISVVCVALADEILHVFDDGVLFDGERHLAAFLVESLLFKTVILFERIDFNSVVTHEEAATLGANLDL